MIDLVKDKTNYFNIQAKKIFLFGKFAIYLHC